MPTDAPAARLLRPGRLTLAELHACWRAWQPIALDPEAWPGVEAATEAVERVIREDRTVYGVNTGFGRLARTRIEAEMVGELQHRLLLSHCAGVGEPLEPEVVRLTLLLKINALARGHSGIRRATLEALIALLNAEAYPVIPGQGSVGASGDLAPLAHLAAALIGSGEVTLAGERLPADQALARIGQAPLRLAAKEGLALINGTQVSTALLLHGLFKSLDLFAAGLVTGAMSVDAALGSDVPFDQRLNALRNQPGQIRVAAEIRRLLDGSGIRASHLDCDRVQDPYSLRCQPQVMGAVLDTLRAAAAMAEREANAVSDNPLVFAETGEVLSGGNFHAEPVALAADMAATALAEIGALSERRLALLTDAALSSLPPFLAREPGLNSGFMVAHVTAAALASENKSLAHPASVDSLPTSANQEDHVSMATFGARRLSRIAGNVANILAIELLGAAEGIDYRQPLQTGPLLAEAHRRLREAVAPREIDRAFAEEIARAQALVESGWLTALLWPDGEIELLGQSPG